MRPVAIAGIGMTPFVKADPRPIAELAAAAVGAALADAGVEPREAGALYLGNFVGEVLTGQGNLANMAGAIAGLGNVPCTKVEGACASAGIALRHAVLAVASGATDVAVAAGVEKMSEADTTAVTRALASAADQAHEGGSGMTFPGFFALVASRYLHESGATPEHLAMVASKNRSNGAGNPIAAFGKTVSPEDVLASRLIADPLRLLDCSPITDGAAAAVVVPADSAAGRAPGAIRVLACEQVRGNTAFYQMDDVCSFPATRLAAKRAYEAAGVAADDIDVVELHDCFSIAELVDFEDLGFAGARAGWRAVAEGETALGGRRPVNPSGGLLARGHPVGATGLAQVNELVRQLRGTAARQVPGAELALAHNLGGTGAVATVTILAR